MGFRYSGQVGIESDSLALVLAALLQNWVILDNFHYLEVVQSS